MTIEHSYIYIEDVRIRAYHGVLPQEHKVGQDYLVSVRVACDISAALEHDMVEVTLNYAEVYDIIRTEMQQPSQLIEHVAGRIGKSIFERFPQAETVALKVTKLNPPMDADCQGVGVELLMRR